MWLAGRKPSLTELFRPTVVITSWSRAFFFFPHAIRFENPIWQSQDDEDGKLVQFQPMRDEMVDKCGMRTSFTLNRHTDPKRCRTRRESSTSPVCVLVRHHTSTQSCKLELRPSLSFASVLFNPICCAWLIIVQPVTKNVGHGRRVVSKKQPQYTLCRIPDKFEGIHMYTCSGFNVNAEKELQIRVTTGTCNVMIAAVKGSFFGTSGTVYHHSLPLSFCC